LTAIITRVVIFCLLMTNMISITKVNANDLEKNYLDQSSLREIVQVPPNANELDFVPPYEKKHYSNL
jgi:hypothetical protein